MIRSRRGKTMQFRTLSLIAAALTIPSASAMADAQQSVQPRAQAVPLKQPQVRRFILNGEAMLKASENSAQRESIGLELPTTLILVWNNPKTLDDTQKIEIARVDAGGTRRVIATHPIRVTGEPSTTSFEVPLARYLPARNNGNSPITYELRVVTTLAVSGQSVRSRAAKVIHQPFGSIEQPKLFAFDPFKCPANTSAPRKVEISIAGYTAFNLVEGGTTTSSNRDELFFFTEFSARNDRSGAPAYSSGKRRTPFGKREFYGTYADIRYGPTFNLNGNTPTNDRPMLWDGTLDHDTALHARVFVRERDHPTDDSYLNISSDVIQEMNRMQNRAAASSNAAPGNAALAGIAQMAASVSQNASFSFSANDHDHRGAFDVIVENVCGQLKYMVIGLRDHTEDGVLYDHRMSPTPARFSMYEASLGAVAIDTFDFKSSEQVWPTPYTFKGREAVTTIFAKRQVSGFRSVDTQIEVAVSVDLP